jgi:hypothetical protein
MPAESRQVLVVQGLLHGDVFSSFPDSGADVDFNNSFESAFPMILQDATSHSDTPGAGTEKAACLQSTLAVSGAARLWRDGRAICRCPNAVHLRDVSRPTGSWSNNEPTENRRSATDSTLAVAGLRLFVRTAP